MAEAQAQAPALPEGLQADIDAFSEDVFNHYISNRTAEEYAADSQRTKEYFENAEQRTQAMAKVSEAFAAADKNGDGLLDADEYGPFSDAMKQMGADRGDFVDERPEAPGKWFDLACRVNPETNGMALSDLFVVMGASIKK